MRGIALAVSCLLAAASAKAADIGAIQGAAHASPEVGERVEAEGVVTLMRGNGFFLQERPMPTRDLGWHLRLHLGRSRRFGRGPHSR